MGEPLPEDLDELVGRIFAVHNSFRRQEIKDAVLAMRNRAKKCVEGEGGHFEGKLDRIP